MIARVALLVLLALPVWAEEAKTPDGKALPSCEGDERCRFDRLRRATVLRRREDLAREAALEAVDRERILRLRREVIPTRRLRPAVFDVFLSTTDSVGQGMAVAWNLTARWQVRGLLTSVAANQWFGDGGDFSAYGMLLGLRGTYFLLRGDTSVFVSGAVTWHDLSVWSWRPPAPDEGDGKDPIDVNQGGGSYIGTAHSALVAIGFDHTFRFGLHLALEVHWLAPFYTQVRDSESGLPDAVQRTSLVDSLAADDLGVGFVFGWSF